MKKSDTGFCTPDFFDRAPASYSILKYLASDPSEMIISSKSRNNCTDTSFIIQNTNNTEADPSNFLLQTQEEPHQALLQVFAEKIGIYEVKVTESANIDATLQAVTLYEVEIHHPCKEVTLSADSISD